MLDASFIQLCSTETQIATDKTANKYLKSNLNKLDGKAGDDLSWNKKSPNIITINKDGVYFIMSVAQVGSDEHVPYIGGDILLWYTENGKILKNSANRIFSSSIERSKIISNQMDILCKKGDKIGLMYSSTASNGGLIAYPDDNDNKLPNAPSLTVTMYKVG